VVHTSIKARSQPARSAGSDVGYFGEVRQPSTCVRWASMRIVKRTRITTWRRPFVVPRDGSW
jgi:hypothetical protein